MFASRFLSRKPKSGPGPQRRVCLGVEVLEGRAVPSAVMANHLPFVSLPDAHATAHFAPPGSGVHVQVFSGEEIPQRG